MLRELYEETDILKEHINCLKYMFTITFPNEIELNVYYIVLNNSYIKKDSIVSSEGVLIWKDIIKNKLLDADKENVAGEGNIAYFIKYVLCREGMK